MDRVLLTLVPAIIMAIFYAGSLIYNLRKEFKGKNKLEEVSNNYVSLLDAELKKKQLGNLRYLLKATGLLYGIGLTAFMAGVVGICLASTFLGFAVIVSLANFLFLTIVVNLSIASRLSRMLNPENNKNVAKKKKGEDND